MDLSIIIPVYKVERYIRFTLESIVHQYENQIDYEVIVVDDGTPDKSMGIVKLFKSSFSNITIVHQTNQGLSAARNAGLMRAKGKYVWFVDSDDALAPNAFNIIHNSITNYDADIFVFSYYTKKEDSDDTQLNSGLNSLSKVSKIYNKVHKGKDLYGIVGMGLVQKLIIQKSFLTKNCLSFLKGVYFEDNEFMVRAFFLANRVIVRNAPLYIYLLRDRGNIMSSIGEKHLMDVMTINCSLDEFARRHAQTHDDYSKINSYIYTNCLWLLCNEKRFVGFANSFWRNNKKEIRRTCVKSGIHSFKFLRIKQKVLFFLLILCPFLLPYLKRH